MKLIITTAIAFILTIGLAQAQHSNIGIKGGLNAYTVRTGTNTFENTKLGFNLGLLGHFHLSDQFAVQPEVLYSLQGTKYEFLGSEVNLNLNYINVPVLFQYMFNHGFRIHLGPQVGFLASAKAKTSSASTDVKDQYKTLDFGVTAGLSLIDPKTNFGVDVRYNLGLTNIYESSNISGYNRGIQLGVFYLINHE